MILLGKLDNLAPWKTHRTITRYKIEIEQKKNEVTTLSLSTYKVSIDIGLRKWMAFLMKLDNLRPGKTVKTMTFEEIRIWVDTLFPRIENTFDEAIIDSCLSGILMAFQLADPEA